MGTKDNSTPEGMANELNQSYDDAQTRAAARDQGQPAQLPTNPLTGDDSADDGVSNTAS